MRFIDVLSSGVMNMVYEYMSNEGPVTARRRFRPAPPPVVAKRPAAMKLGLAALLLGCWIVGAYAGIVYWALTASLWGVILSAVVPGLGAAWAMSLLQGAEAASDLRNE